MSTAIATIGHNNPPEPTPFDLDQQAITDLYEEAKLWLDGEQVETQDQADAINFLKDKIRKAETVADENRKAQQKPFKDKLDALQDMYNTLIGNNKSVKGLSVKALEACNAALLPYLSKLKAKQDEEARLAREEAARKQAEAMEAMRQRDAANLQQREEAERLAREAKEAENAARAAEKVKAHAKGGVRATGLRTVYRAEMTDLKAAAAWVWKERNAELSEFVQDLADKAVRDKVREIPGFKIIEEYTV